MSEQMNWRVYYADYSTFDSLQGEPEDAPVRGVQLIIQRHHDLRERPFFQWMKDYYVFKHGRWYAADSDGLRFYLFIEDIPHHRAQLAGQTVDNETWERIREMAKVDPDFFGD